MPVSVQIESITPILVVAEIESGLQFWKKLGFERIVEVPHGERLGFIMFRIGTQNLMLQTETSADADIVGIAPRCSGGVIYLNVQSIETIERMLDASSIVIPKRKTFYGATEIWVREPGGNLVGFAEHQH